jgi:hypothetical protein
MIIIVVVFLLLCSLLFHVREHATFGDIAISFKKSIDSVMLPTQQTPKPAKT